MTGKAFVHTGYAANKVNIGAHWVGQAEVIWGDDCCSKQLCVQPGHHLGGADCCVNNHLPVFALPAPFAG